MRCTLIGVYTDSKFLSLLLRTNSTIGKSLFRLLLAEDSTSWEVVNPAGILSISYILRMENC